VGVGKSKTITATQSLLPQSRQEGIGSSSINDTHHVASTPKIPYGRIGPRFGDAFGTTKQGINTAVFVTIWNIAVRGQSIPPPIFVAAISRKIQSV
jgi:hypothetical protein